MAGFFHGDPYFPIEGGAGWIEEDPEEDPEENSEEERVMDLDDDPPADSDDDTERGEPDSEIDDPEVVNRRYAIRSRDEPLPPPSFQVYRHPNGGPLWMHTPRKRILPIRRQDTLRISIPDQDAVTPPRWAAQLQDWSREQGLRPPYGMCQEFFDLSNGSSADRALPVTIGRVSRIDTQLRATSGQLDDIRTETRATATRVHQISAHQFHNQETIHVLQDDLAAARAEIHALHERMADYDRRTIAAETRATAAEQITESVTRASVEMSERLTSYFGI